MKYILWLFRIIVGVLFIFSGLVKANDPSGLSYKMDEFFEVWGMLWALKYSLALSIMMIGFEIIAGVALLIGAAFGFFSFLLLLLTLFFTFLTAYVYLPHVYTSWVVSYPKIFPRLIEECGCFGDCIKISNAETFWKDVILLALVIILFVFRKRIQPLCSNKGTIAVMLITIFLAFGVQWYTLKHLPFHDCLPYKIGANIWEKMQPPPGSTPDVYQNTYTLKNAVTGASKKISDKEYVDSGIWQDTTWQIVGEPTTELIKKGNASPAIKDFAINDAQKNDHTEELLKAKGYTFFLFLKKPQEANTANMNDLRNLMEQTQKLGIPFYILSSGSEEATTKFRNDNNLPAGDFLSIDYVANKTATRSDPALIILKDGVIIHKCSYADYPQNIAMDNGALKLKN